MHAASHIPFDYYGVVPFPSSISNLPLVNLARTRTRFCF